MVQIKIKLYSNVQNYQIWAPDNAYPPQATHNQHLLKKMEKMEKMTKIQVLSNLPEMKSAKNFFSQNVLQVQENTLDTSTEVMRPIFAAQNKEKDISWTIKNRQKSFFFMCCNNPSGMF